MLEEVLKAAGVTEVYVGGLALDYCVAYTCKDAAGAGFRTFCVRDACRGIAADTMDKEMAAMTAVGVHLLDTADEVPAAAGGGGSGSGSGSAAAPAPAT